MTLFSGCAAFWTLPINNGASLKMTIDDEFLDEIEEAANLVSTALNIPQANGGDGKIYELWLLFKLAEALSQDGYHVEVRGSDDRPATDFIQRGSPGKIPPVGSAQPKPGFIVFRTGQNEEFEIHNSLQFNGRSTAFHEYDIAIIRRDLGRWLRNHGGGRPTGHPRFSIECKQYSSNIQLGVLRDMFGQQVDGTYLGGHIRYHQNAGACGVHNWRISEGRTYPNYRTAFRNCFISILTPMKLSSGAVKLSDHHFFNHFEEVIPTNPKVSDFLTAAIRWIRSNLGGP